MAKKDKTLCKWKRREIDERFAELREIVTQPRYVCGKCGRAAAKKKWLCKPKAL